MSETGGFSSFSKRADGKPDGGSGGGAHGGHRHGGNPGGHHSNAQTGPSSDARNTRAVWLAFIIACIGYLVLSSQQPAGWGVPLWMLLAWLIIPAIAAFALNRVQAPGRLDNRLFKAGMKGVGWAMFFYSAITMRALAHRVGGGNGFQGFLAGLLTSTACTLIAGAVAGGVNVLLARLLSRGAHRTSAA